MSTTTDTTDHEFMVQFVLPLEGGKLPMTLNTQRNMHYRQVARIKKQTEVAVGKACAEQGIPALYQVTEILFTLVVGDRRMRDADNMAPLGKATLDSLARTGVLEEDHYKIVNRVSYNIHYDKAVKTNYALVTIWALPSPDDIRNGITPGDIRVDESATANPEKGRVPPPVIIPEEAKTELKEHKEEADRLTREREGQARRKIQAERQSARPAGSKSGRKGRVLTVSMDD